MASGGGNVMKRSLKRRQDLSDQTENSDPEREAPEEVVCFSHVSMSFGLREVLHDISFTLQPGSRTVLYGPSGSGKSTVLRLLCGLLQPSAGKVTVNCKDNLAMVFQEDRLFEALSCYDNIAYGLNAACYSQEEIRRRVLYWADIFNCTEYLFQKTATLSGGQRQRAALARAFMKNPDLVLMDESFSSMDVELKSVLMKKVLDIQNERHFTLVFVTHNYDEARTMAQSMLVIKNGRLVQYGSVWDVSLEPADLFEARAFGGFTYNILPWELLRSSLQIQDRNFPEPAWFGISAWNCSVEYRKNWLCLEAVVKKVHSLGFCFLYELNCQGNALFGTSVQKVSAGSVWLNPGQIQYFGRDGLRVPDCVQSSAQGETRKKE